MGSFGGHIIPGVVIFFLGLWQTIASLKIYFQRKRQGKEYFGHVAHPISCCCFKWNLPWEGIIKVIGTLMGMSVEQLGFFWHYPEMIQHFTMYGFFLLAGIVDILIFYKITLPKDLDFAVHILAFSGETLLFYFHLHGRTHLDVTVHTLLVYACFFCVVSLIIELRFRNNVLGPLARGYFIMLQGSWLFQIGFIIYHPFGPAWDDKNHDNLMIAIIIAGWHMISLFALQLIVFLIMAKCYRTTTTIIIKEQFTKVRTIDDDDDDDRNEEKVLISSFEDVRLLSDNDEDN